MTVVPVTQRARRIRWWLEDAVPPLTLPLTHFAAMLVRSPYRRYVIVERRIARVLSPNRVVLGGPFRGMRYITEASGSALLPKLAGTYELEIAGSVEDAIQAAPDVVVNIGTAEGYYAVGCARRLPSARIVALDSRRSARWLSRRLARANGVVVEVMGQATHAVLRDLCAGADHPLIICDIDGGERDLLDPVRVPELSKARLLVETHDLLAPGVTQELTERFSGTHDVRRKRVLPRDPSLVSLPSIDAAVALDERRPEQSWLVGVPRSG